MEIRKVPDAQAHAILLAAARGYVADGADFTVNALLTGTGITKAQFRRCFAGKKQLLAALTRDDAKALGEILDVAQPVELQRAVGSDIAPAAPATDAWLERRLRVFERALTGLEKRQEKSEQSLGRQLALLEEKLDARNSAPAVEPTALLFDPAESNLLPADPVAPEPGPPSSLSSAPHSPDLTPSDLTSPDPASPDLAPAVLAHVEEIAAQAGEPEPIGEKEMADFIAYARQVARNAVPPPPKKRRRGLVREVMIPAVILIGGVLVIGATLLLASTMPRAMPAAPVSHRRIAQQGIARIIALAGSGDANAETALALTYIRAADTAAARRWSMAAAMQGQPVAQYLLGTLDLGDDPDEAVRWLGAAAGQGNLKAMHNLAIAYAQGLGVARDPAMAVRWFGRAAASGYRDSEFDLAVLYERGLGVPQSGGAALKWYLIAAGQGDAPSAARAAALKDQMDPAEARKAAAAAAAFVPLPAALFANAAPYS